MKGNGKKALPEEKASPTDKSEKKLPLKPANPLRTDAKPKTQFAGSLNPIKERVTMKKPFGSNVISNGNNKVVRNDEGYKINAGSKEDRWKQNDPPPKRGNGTRFPLLRVEKDPSVVFGKPARLPVRSQTMCGKPGDCKTETRATAKEKTGLKVEKGKASEAEWEDSEGEGRSPEVQDLDEKVVDRKRLDKKTMAKNVSSYEEWKRKNNLEPNCKVYIVNKCLRDLRESMAARGWVENPDLYSPYYDFRWTIKSKDVIFSEVLDHQMVNHFSKNTIITTKSGLAKSLRMVNCFHDVDDHSFFPLCFNLETDDELKDFELEYRFSYAVSQARKFLSEVEAKGVSNAEAFQAGQVCSAMAALLAASKRLIEMDEVIDLPEVNFDPGVSVEEHQLVELDQRREGTSALARLKDLVRKNRLMYGIVCPGELLDIMLQSKLRLEAGLNAWDAGWTEGLAAAEEDGPVISENGRLLQAMAQLIRSNFERLKKKDCQFDFYGKEHLWILKPGTSSRGRGIEVFARLDKILSRRSENRKVPWIVQKYMENSLLVRGRKFDIRQWILITDWNPLTVWFYEDCYVRFACQKYTSEDLHAFVHLTNNSVSKHKKVDWENEEQRFFGKNMWSSEQFSGYLKEQAGYDVYHEKIKPKIKDLAIWTMSSSQDMIDNRKNSMELFGLDVMIDLDYEAYLLEVNSSPSMEHSTPVTAKLVQEVSEDLIKVTVDNLNGRKKVLGDTGKFTCITKRKGIIEKPSFYMNFNYPIIGKKITNFQNI